MLYCLTSRDRLLEVLPKGGIGAEIGVAEGNFSESLLRHAAPSHLVLIDPWAEYDAYRLDQDANAVSAGEQEQRYQAVRQRFAPQIETGRVRIDRAFSPVAADAFADHTFDWVYIDGNHSYEAVAADLRAWAPKVKPGGALLGHDYFDGIEAEQMNFGVVPAVDEFVIASDWHFVALTADGCATFMLQRRPANVLDAAFMEPFLRADLSMIEIKDFPHKRRMSFPAVLRHHPDGTATRLLVPSF